MPSEPNLAHTVPVRDALDSGAWFDCTCTRFGEEKRFRIRFLGFEPKGLDEVENLAGVDPVIHEGVLWVLKFEVVSLMLREENVACVRCSFVLVDDDGCVFGNFEDDALYGGQFGKREGLQRFKRGLFNVLRPKMIAKGAIAYLLPDEDGVRYSLAAYGTFQEI